MEINPPNQMLPIKTKQSVIKFSILFTEFNSGRIIFPSHSKHIPFQALLFNSEYRKVTKNKVFL